ncbi:carbohydrate ABC transporter substrate-binding protein (CUT1 family) [Motilibacter rhizosphaerae]|uniref:Carbohydrate ABC transporter substrate-binding protein (CUT1 family) n=1 Tax=Motilibacter rhizosphaerae TaxID=598652 RepID=A0A4Q7NT25_9ACTN|nr:ABC transporter substrate-binding protein [Motilibacter rhizosphaerae]RZS90030.1 carbohydrate ABC transporter substrate-binding protein (CUT1 family) [Motilibacter rhizosphaerae]
MPWSRSGVRATAITALAAAPLVLTGCTGQPAQSSSSGSGSAATTQTSVAPQQHVTISFWHGWSQPHELAAINQTIAAFEKAHPNITVKATGNITDDKILQGIRSGHGPDVVSSFTTDNVGAFCKAALVDLGPMLTASHIDKDTTFVKTMVQYTQYKGVQCALPLLGDAYGLYYNKKMFAAAGISRPPRTFSELQADAVKLTKQTSSGYSQLGFMPVYHMYETPPSHWMSQYGVTWQDASGKSNLSKDPHVAQFLAYQQGLVSALGGFAKLEKYRSTFGDEFSAQNPFEVGKVAMALDGEWRVASIASDKAAVDYATAPFPVPDDMASTYGRGYLTGTIVGISRTSKQQAAAWEFTRFLTTDTTSLVGFANAINNVPSTQAALQSPALTKDPAFQTFLSVARNPESSTTPASPNGGQYQVLFQDFAYDVEAGKVKDVAAGLRQVDSQIDRAAAQAAG